MKSKESQNQKYSREVKKIFKSLITNNDSRGGNKSQSSQALSWSYKKDFCSNHKSQQGQSIIPIIDNNVTAVKKNRKQGSDKDLSQVKYYIYHKKSYYTNKYFNMEPKNQCQFQ